MLRYFRTLYFSNVQGNTVQTCASQDCPDMDIYRMHYEDTWIQHENNLTMAAQGCIWVHPFSLLGSIAAGVWLVKPAGVLAVRYTAGFWIQLSSPALLFASCLLMWWMACLQKLWAAPVYCFCRQWVSTDLASARLFWRVVPAVTAAVLKRSNREVQREWGMEAGMRLHQTDYTELCAKCKINAARNRKSGADTICDRLDMTVSVSIHLVEKMLWLSWQESQPRDFNF